MTSPQGAGHRSHGHGLKRYLAEFHLDGTFSRQGLPFKICPSVPGEFLDERASQLRLREIWNDTKELSIVTQVQLFSSQTCFWRHEQDLETCSWSFDRNPHQFTIIKKLHFSSILYPVISVPINDNREHRVLESKREKWKNRTCRAKIQNSCYKLESSWQLCTADLLFCKDAKSCQSFHTEISQNWHVSICQK